MASRPCLTCGTPADGSYCREHEPEPWGDSKRRQRVRLSGGAEQARARRVLRAYATVCHVCGRPGATEVDHVVPLAEGGADDETNLAPVHATPCHQAKTAAEAARGRARGVRGPSSEACRVGATRRVSDSLTRPAAPDRPIGAR